MILIRPLPFELKRGNLKGQERQVRRGLIWNLSSHPQEISTEAMFLQKLAYIHHNVVLAGYVERPEEWPYSSARNYSDLPYILPVLPHW
jgi:hypothetical protein